MAALFVCAPLGFIYAKAPTPEQPVTLPILTYHYVETAQGKSGKRGILVITPQIFEKQLEALRERGYETIFVREIPAMLSSPLSHRIAITFDDGYEDFYTNVLPLLKENDMKATLYVVTDFIGRPGYLTASELEDIIASELVEIGAHTAHHKNLTPLSSAKAQEEIEGSKRTLEQDYGLTVETFAYPYGKHSARVEAMVEGAGFTAAVTTERGFAQSPTHLFALKRIPAGAFTGSRKWKAIGDVSVMPTVPPPSPKSSSSASSAPTRPPHLRKH
jgi:peptidoglycan/xylan/chitin deacetylase (PgdA/CDA1 family)